MSVEFEKATIFMPKVILIEQLKELKSVGCLKNQKGDPLKNLIAGLHELGY